MCCISRKLQLLFVCSSYETTTLQSISRRRRRQRRGERWHNLQRLARAGRELANRVDRNGCGTFLRLVVTLGRCEKVKRKTQKIASRDWNDSTMHDKNVSRVRCNSVPKSLLRKSARKAERIAGNHANVLPHAYSDILSCLITFLLFLHNFDDILFLLNAFFI